MCRSVWIRNSLSWLAGKGAQAFLPGLLCPELLYRASLPGFFSRASLETALPFSKNGHPSG